MPAKNTMQAIIRIRYFSVGNIMLKMEFQKSKYLTLSLAQEGSGTFVSACTNACILAAGGAFCIP